MANILVTRRYIKQDYFESKTGGYFVVNGTSNVSGGRHWECGRLTDLTSRSIIYTFPTAFPTGVTPVGYSNLRVYRMFKQETGMWVRQDVLFYHPTAFSGASQYGFQLNIDPNEDLTGVIVEFMFTE